MTVDLLDRLKDDGATFTRDEVLELVRIHLDSDTHKQVIEQATNNLKQVHNARLLELEIRRSELEQRIARRRAVSLSEQTQG